MSDKMRSEFEKWYKSQAVFHKAHLVPLPNGCYFGSVAETAWRAWQAAQSVSVPVVGDVVAYDLSSDYVKLLEFLKAGNDAAGFVTTDDYHNGDVVGITRRGPYNIHIGCRGYSFASVYPFNSEDGSEELVFIKACEFAGLKWIKPATSITAAELDALRKDAERYRWIRNPANPAEKVVLYKRGKLGCGVFAFIALDQAIDAAIAGETNHG